MSERREPEVLFLEHLDWIDRVTRFTCGRHGVWGEDADDFAARVKTKLVENDHAVFRNFRGESALETYLSLVVVREFQEYRRARGRYSAKQERERNALTHAIEQLEPEEQVIARMHFANGYPLAEIARLLHMNQKQLYRRVEKLRLRMRGFVDEPLRDFSYSGILGPDGIPLTQEELKHSRIITDLTSTNEKILEMVRKDPDMMYSLPPRQFEELVAELLHQQGYEIELTPPSNDGGFDMYAARKDGLGTFLYLVECKRYAPVKPVGVGVVRALYGVVQNLQASAGIVVTTSHFTKGAHAFQQSVSHQLSLRDYLHLQQWLGETST